MYFFYFSIYNLLTFINGVWDIGIIYVLHYTWKTVEQQTAYIICPDLTIIYVFYIPTLRFLMNEVSLGKTRVTASRVVQNVYSQFLLLLKENGYL